MEHVRDLNKQMGDVSFMDTQPLQNQDENVFHCHEEEDAREELPAVDDAVINENNHFED